MARLSRLLLLIVAGCGPASAGIASNPLQRVRAIKVEPPPWVREQYDKLPGEWKERLRAVGKYVRTKPRRSLGFYVALRLYIAHVRIQLEKRAALKAFRALGPATTNGAMHITVVTTAALPWKTGTAVNALLRVAYLAELGHNVTLVVPWIHPDEQATVFPGGISYATPALQEAQMREWLEARDGEHRPFQIKFYPARYDIVRGSILPLGDLTKWSADEKAARDLCVLEEPEHLTWYHGHRNWRRRFKMVLGVVHTNYIAYAEQYQPENVWVVRWFNELVCRVYCDRVVKLSDCLQQLPRATVCNVHGVRSEFIAEGRRRAANTREARKFEQKGAYFIGKLLWAKGHKLLIEYLSGEEEESVSGRQRTLVDVFGDGEDRQDVEEKAKEAGLNMRFMGGKDHADPALHGYKVFVNPSRTEVLSTTTAEALAMGKFVVIERHPSNAFFYDFPNALLFSTPEEFRAKLFLALSTKPQPLTPEESRALSWAGATERFLQKVEEASQIVRTPSIRDEYAHLVHRALSGHQGYAGDALKHFVFESG